MAAAKFQITRKCKICGETFMAKTIESWYCSPKCSRIAYKRRKDEEARHQKLDEIVKHVNDNVKVYQKIIQKYTTSTECCKGTKSLLYITYC